MSGPKEIGTITTDHCNRLLALVRTVSPNADVQLSILAFTFVAHCIGNEVEPDDALEIIEEMFKRGINLTRADQ